MDIPWKADFDLKQIFCIALKHYATEHVNHIEALFDCISNMMQKNNYHNITQLRDLFEFINLIYNENGFFQSTFGYLPKPIIVSLFLQNTTLSFKRSAAYAKEALEYYGVGETIIQDICELILVGERLSPPEATEAYEIKLMHDLRNTRLAYDWDRFMINVAKLRKEFESLDEKKFLRLHFKLYNFLNNQKKLFSISVFGEHLNPKAFSNVNKYMIQTRVNYFQFLNNEEVEEYLKDSSKEAAGKENRNNIGINDIIEDNFTKIFYRIKEFGVNGARVTVYNSRPPAGQLWSIIPNTELYSARFKKIITK